LLIKAEPEAAGKSGRALENRLVMMPQKNKKVVFLQELVVDSL
jgi:hypothetical protein